MAGISRTQATDRDSHIDKARHTLDSALFLNSAFLLTHLMALKQLPLSSSSKMQLVVPRETDYNWVFLSWN